MVSLPVIILEILGDHAPQMFLSKENHSIRSLPFKGAMESLQVGIAVGRLCRQADRANAGAFKQPPKGSVERTAPVHKKIPFLAQKTAKCIGKVASDLQHPRGVGMRCDPGAGDLPIRQIHYGKNVAGHQSTLGPDLDCREVDRRQARPMRLYECRP